MSPSKTSSRSRTSSRTSTPAKTSTATKPSKINYNFDSRNESASDYNKRIASARGDSASSLKSMQRVTKSTFAEQGMDANQKNGGRAVITAESLKPTPQIKLAAPPPIDGMFGQTGIANASLAGGMGGSYDTANNQIVPAPAPKESATDPFQKLLTEYTGAKDNLAAPSNVDAFNKIQKELRPKENLRNSLAGQLNVIQADSNAAQLSLEGQGRGQTGGFIGGEQARINREAAIKSMPIQAQLAIAQDDLDSARSYYTQYYQAKMQDEQNTYNLKKENLQNLYSFLTAQETRKQAASEKLLDRQYAETQQLMSAKAQMISKALGQGAPAAVQQAIDSATTLAGVATAAGKYNGDLLAQEAQRANIAQSWASVAASNAVRVAAQSQVTNALSYEDNAKFNATPEAKAVKDGTKYAAAVKNYKEAINTYGTGELFGKGAGILNEAYSSLVGATKDYYTLGTYDNGVEKLIGLGIPKPSMFGLKANRIGALDSALATAKDVVNRNISQLNSTGFAGTQELKSLASEADRVLAEQALAKEEQAELNSMIKQGSSNSTTSMNFTPYFQP